MTVKRKTAILLMAAVLCALCAGCAGQEKTQSEPAKPSALNVYLTNGYKYAPIRVLENDALRAELETSLGVVIHMHYRDQQQDIGLLNTEEINGIIQRPYRHWPTMQKSSLWIPPAPRWPTAITADISVCSMDMFSQRESI